MLKIKTVNSLIHIFSLNTGKYLQREAAVINYPNDYEFTRTFDCSWFMPNCSNSYFVKEYPKDFDKDSTLDEVISYLKNHWDLIHDPNLIAPKQVQSNIEKIRETIIRAIYYNHKELSAYDTRKIIAYVSRREEALSNLADNLTDKEIYTIRQRLRQDLKKDWFAHVFPDYENDLRSNRLLYKDWKDSYYRNKYRDVFGCPDAKVKRLVRFELTFDHNSRKFSLTKV